MWYQPLSDSEISTRNKFVDSISAVEIVCEQLGKDNKLSPPLPICSLFCGVWVEDLSEAKPLPYKKLDVFQDVFKIE